ncbi:hypothetical protein JCM11641_002522 [Rhodosporidiobolus odoratus]
MSRVTDKNKGDDEDAAQLKFGPNFQDEDTQGNMLSISEVKLLIDNIAANDPLRVPDNAIFNKTREYVETFARFHEQHVVANVRESMPDFHVYETVQLMNLCPMESEEAKALIPSLKMEDEPLQTHLDNLSTHRKHQG